MGRAKAGNAPGYHRAPLRMPAGYQVNADTEAVEGLAAELRDFVSNSALRQSRDEGHSSTSSPGDRHHHLTPVQVRLRGGQECILAFVRSFPGASNSRGKTPLMNFLARVSFALVSCERYRKV